MQNQFASTTYTHHQKSIICDANGSSPNSTRRIIAYVGGLDLTEGRYDTPNHELFSTLLNENEGDFRNANCSGSMVKPTQGNFSNILILDHKVGTLPESISSRLVGELDQQTLSRHSIKPIAF